MTTIFAFIFWIAGLQGIPTPPVPQAPRLPARTTVEGTTVRSDASDSVSYVTLRLVPLDDPGTVPLTGRGGANPSGNYQATSDAVGQFQFSNVAPGRYAISAEREGYVRAEQFLPGPRQSTQSILTIAAGMKVDGMVVVMIPVPAISGTVYTPLGQRLAGATVSAYRVQYTPYGRQLVRVASALSHEGGEYRLFRLAPGYYYLSASYSDRSIRPWKSILKLSPNLMNPDDGYSTVYYPGDMKVANAKVINLYNGAAVNVDIGFKETRYFKLSMKVLLPPPQEKVPPLRNVKLALFPVGTDLGSAQDFVVQGSGTNFSVDHLAEGEYVLVALADFQDALGNTYSGIVSDTLPVRVTDDAIVSITTMYPFELPVNIPRLTNGVVPNGVQLQLARVDPLANQTITMAVSPSGQVSMPNVGPGVYDVVVQGLPRNLNLQEAGFPYSDRRLLQIRVDANLPPRAWHCEGDCREPRLISDVPLTATISSAGTTVNGRVTDGIGGNVAGAEVVLVPTEAAARLRKDRYGVTYSDASGTFQLQGIRPGAYMAFAFEKLEPDIYFDPEFNNQIARQGVLVSVGSGLNRPLERALTVITMDDLLRLTR